MANLGYFSLLLMHNMLNAVLVCTQKLCDICRLKKRRVVSLMIKTQEKLRVVDILVRDELQNRSLLCRPFFGIPARGGGSKGAFEWFFPITNTFRHDHLLKLHSAQNRDSMADQRECLLWFLCQCLILVQSNWNVATAAKQRIIQKGNYFISSLVLHVAVFPNSKIQNGDFLSSNREFKSVYLTKHKYSKRMQA